MNNVLNSREVVPQKLKPYEIRTVEIESFVDHIEGSVTMVQDIMYFLYSSLEEVVDQIQKDNNVKFKKIIKDSFNIDIESKVVGVDEINQVDLILQKREFGLQSMQTVNNVQIMRGMAGDINALNEFKEAEKLIEKNLESENTPISVYACLESLLEPAKLIFSNNKTKLPSVFTFQDQKIDTYGELIHTLQLVRFEAYSIFFEKYKTNFYKAMARQDSQIGSQNVNNNLTLLFLSKTKVDEIFETIKLSDLEQKLFDCYFRSGLRISGDYIIPFTKNKSANIIENKMQYLLLQLNKNIWVTTKVESEITTLNTGNYKDRKALTKIKLELFRYYGDVFDEMQNIVDSKDREDENLQANDLDPESDIQISPYQEQVVRYSDYQFTPNEKPVENSTESNSVSSFLDEAEYREYAANSSKQIQAKIQTIIDFIFSEKIDESQNLGKVTYSMKYIPTLPMIPNQYCTMRFGRKVYPNCLKLNINSGDRLLVYFDEKGMLKLKFISAQTYHNSRSQ
jgi:hypothetical protein